MSLINGGFGASGGINPVNGLGNIPTSQVDVYDGATLSCPNTTGSLNDILAALDACISDKNGTFTPSNSGLFVADGFVVNLTDDAGNGGGITWNGSVDAPFNINGLLTVDFIDPQGIAFVPMASNPATTWGSADAVTIWINSADGHIYRDTVDLELGGTTSTTTYDGAATLSTCAFPVSGNVNDVLSTLADEICANKDAINNFVGLTGTARHSTFRVDVDDLTVVEDDFLTHTGSAVGIGVGSAGSHTEALTFGSLQVAIYNPDRVLSDPNHLVDKQYVGDTITATIGSIPISLWEEGLTNTDTTFLSETDNNVVIGDSDILTNSKLLITQDQNLETLVTIENTTIGADAAAIFEAVGNIDETARLGFYSSGYSLAEWQDKAVLSSGINTSGLLLNSNDDIILQSGGTDATNNIVNVSTTGVSIGTDGIGSTATLQVSGTLVLEDLGAGTTNDGDVLTLQADGTAAFEAPSIDVDTLYSKDSNINEDREFSGLNDDAITKHSLTFDDTSEFNVASVDISLSASENFSIDYSDSSDFVINNGNDNEGKILIGQEATVDNPTGLVDWVDHTIENLTNVPALPTISDNYVLQLNTGGNFDWITKDSLGGTSKVVLNFVTAAGIPLNINHALNSEDIITTTYDVAIGTLPKKKLETEIEIVDADNLTITTATAQTGQIVIVY